MMTRPSTTAMMAPLRRLSPCRLSWNSFARWFTTHLSTPWPGTGEAVLAGRRRTTAGGSAPGRGRLAGFTRPFPGPD